MAVRLLLRGAQPDPAAKADVQPKNDRVQRAEAMVFRMKDIAQDLGFSSVTVSKVLRNHPDIGEETRQRVLKRVAELDFRPNVVARGLATGRSYLVGLVVPELRHSFFCRGSHGPFDGNSR
jgi:hypothetical protein